jgi:H+-translocating NAD(P) transhydrogenase subunit alpha
MTGGLLIALYLFTLAAFLGLDVIRKVPPTLYGALATSTGAAAALSVALAFPAAGASPSGPAALLALAAVVIGTAGVVGGLVRARRTLRAKGDKR